MSRGQEKKVVSQGTAQSAQDQANANAAFGGANKAIGDYRTALTGFMAADPYKEGGAYQTAQSAVGNNVAAAGQNALASDVNENAARTNENSANNAAVIAESRRAGQRNLANFLANANQDRFGKDTAYRTTGLEASSRIPGMYSSLYAPSVSGAVGNLGVAGGAAKTPGFWDTFGDSFAGSLGKTLGGGNAKG